MRTGIYGGTFDPPHLGHMAAARAAGRIGLDRLILIPDGQPPHKALSAASASPEQRLAMTELAADRLHLEIPVTVSAMEVRRAGRSYTSDTLAELHRALPDDELWLLMGTDMFLTLQDWHDPETITRLAGICAFGRAQGEGEDLFTPQRERLERRFGARVVTVTLSDLVEISSTELRAMLARGEGREYLDESVWGYILREGLYGTMADLRQLALEELRAVSASMVRAKRIPHIRGTEETAARMARRWGADETAARQAAILHDCTKYYSLRRQLTTCAKYGMLLDDIEQKTLPLLHAKSGAALARHVFGMPEAVSEAIRWHTTGKADMTLLEKILYIADYAEPTRRYDWAPGLRALIEEDLDAAVLRGLEITIAENAREGKPIHYRTLEARDWLLAERGEKG